MQGARHGQPEGVRGAEGREQLARLPDTATLVPDYIMLLSTRDYDHCMIVSSTGNLCKHEIQQPDQMQVGTAFLALHLRGAAPARGCRGAHARPSMRGMQQTSVTLCWCSALGRSPSAFRYAEVERRRDGRCQAVHGPETVQSVLFS